MTVAGVRIVTSAQNLPSRGLDFDRLLEPFYSTFCILSTQRALRLSALYELRIMLLQYLLLQNQYIK